MTSRTVSNGLLPSSHREFLTSDPPSGKRDDGGDEGFGNWKGEALVATGAHLDHEHPAVGEDGGRDATSDESPAKDVALSVDVDDAVRIDAADERHSAAGPVHSMADWAVS